MSEQTLELQIKSKADEASSSIDKLIKSLTNIESTVNKIQVSIDGTSNKATTRTDKLKKNIDSVKSSTDKATSSVGKLGKALSLSGAYLAIKRLSSTMLSWLDTSIDRSEQLNLFNVVFKNVEKDGVKTFSKLGKEALQFQNKMNEVFGTNMTETLKYQGLFRSMGDNVGIPEEYSALMSETMTKFTYDLASLYNKSETNTAEALRAGVYAG